MRVSSPIRRGAGFGSSRARTQRISPIGSGCGARSIAKAAPSARRRGFTKSGVPHVQRD
jgi:hypothetical protein